MEVKAEASRPSCCCWMPRLPASPPPQQSLSATDEPGRKLRNNACVGAKTGGGFISCVSHLCQYASLSSALIIVWFFS